LPFLFGAAGALLGGRLSDRLVRTTGSRRWGRSGIGLAGFTGAGLCVLATGWTTKPRQAGTLLFLAHLLHHPGLPVIWAVCADIGGRYTGTVSGIMNMVGGVGGMLSPTLTPVLRENLPWSGVFAVLAGAWFVAAAAWLFIDASRPLVPEESPGRID